MLQSLVVCMAILMFSIMACDPRANQPTKNSSDLQASNNDNTSAEKKDKEIDI